MTNFQNVGKKKVKPIFLLKEKHCCSALRSTFSLASPYTVLKLLKITYIS